MPNLVAFSCRLLIYPAMDEPVLELWISSLRSTAESGFNMKLGDPRNLSNFWGGRKDDPEPYIFLNPGSLFWVVGNSPDEQVASM